MVRMTRAVGRAACGEDLVFLDAMPALRAGDLTVRFTLRTFMTKPQLLRSYRSLRLPVVTLHTQTWSPSTLVLASFSKGIPYRMITGKSARLNSRVSGITARPGEFGASPPKQR